MGQGRGPRAWAKGVGQGRGPRAWAKGVGQGRGPSPWLWPRHGRGTAEAQLSVQMWQHVHRDHVHGLPLRQVERVHL